jgi:4-hydroxythreonine-4-phosphate dehydrogenase
MPDKLVLAIPMGDPAGIGPEIILKALAGGIPKDRVAIVVTGDRHLFERTGRDCGSAMPFEEVAEDREEVAEALARGCDTVLLHMPLVDLGTFSYGKIDGMCGIAAYRAIEETVALVNHKIADAIVTPPLHKESLRAGGIEFIGHTEILGALTDTPSPVTMFETLGLKIFFMTRHLSLRDACDAVTAERVYRSIRECHALTMNPAFDASRPFVVAALNPHGGEHGLFGDEEERAIVPAIRRAREEGMDVTGPVGADSVFHLTRRGDYRAVLSLYHDQGHIAAKTLDFERTVSVTWGLPFLRTSVDHGTAFDIAGKGIASAVSMREAIEVAIRYRSGAQRRS